ncbi:hypothetical protein EBU94_05915, partial [bacterium]|nr:hypothetical protein [bacterium]
TRASKLLFGDVKAKEPEAKEAKGKEERKEVETAKETGEVKPTKKAKRMSKEDIFQAMNQMNPEQLAQMPLEVRQEYFKMLRKPPSNSDFDNMSYEALSVKFGLSPISNLPYNQQVLNALMFLAKMKAGASEQELQTYTMMAPAAMEFTRAAFFTARKILSQVGDQCIQNLVSNVESGGKAVNAEGAVDMECGNYKFKISAGGEISLSTTEFDQSNKGFKGMIASSLMRALSNPELLQRDPEFAQIMQTGQQNSAEFSTLLIPDEMLATIMADENLKAELQQMKLKNSAGREIGPVIDEDGNLNPKVSLSNYKSGWLSLTKSLLKGAKSSQKSPLKSEMVSSILKTYLRGDNAVNPEEAPNHLVTINGVFPLTDSYFDLISKQADFDVKPAKDVINSSNIGTYKSSAAETLKKYRTIVEEKQSKKVSLKDILVPIQNINPIEMMVKKIVDNNDFLMNASLLPGFSPKDLNAVEYNYLKIGKKLVRIPVLNNEKIANQVIGESYTFLNDVLIEALTNNFVLSSLVQSRLINDVEEELFKHDSSVLLEGAENNSPLKDILSTILERIESDPQKLMDFISFIEEEYKRDYKKEYKNYHGKAKQRKERAARTAARELMIKKGRVKKGDGKDIDH